MCCIGYISRLKNGYSFQVKADTSDTTSTQLLETSTESNLVDQLEQYVVQNNDGTFSLDIPEDKVSTFDSNALSNIQNNMQQVNTLVDEGQLQTDSSLNVYDPNAEQYSIQDGINKVVWHWWGFTIYLNHAKSQNLAWALAYGTGVGTVLSGILGIIPGGQLASGVGWILTGLVGMGSAAIFMHDKGNGVALYLYAYCIPWAVSQ